jgi:hypothetical protein
MRTCQRCKLEQDLEQFTGRQTTCRSCFKIYNREYFLNNRDRYKKTPKAKERDKERYQQKREDILLNNKIKKRQNKLRDKADLTRMKHFRRILNKPQKKDFEIYTSNEIWAKETEYLHFDLRFFPIFQKSV